MPSSTDAAKHNARLDLSGKTAAVAGGTQGIGAAVGLRFAQAGASVFIIGRNEQLGQDVVKRCRAEAGKNADGRTFEFIKADLSSVNEVKRVAEEIKAKAGSNGIDYLVTTQGGPPAGKYELTASTPAHDAHFAVQTLSRFGLAYLLAQSGTLKDTWLSVCAPGGAQGPPADADDIELEKPEHRNRWMLGRIMGQGKQDGALGDAMAVQFTKHFPKLRSAHLFPGYVFTNAPANILPSFILPLVNLGGPLLARMPFGNLAHQYAEVPVYVAANPLARGQGLEFSNERMKPLGSPKWAEGEVGAKVWERLRRMIEE
ncbi:putative short-chain dehydrogenase/reductase [Rhodotorula paludigena]|uniref:putative short-chain dehydrogenase/reductase n=1 Tax=Rhodotorula paludigena TaxID=86838 RepID=UPI00316FB24F